MILTELSVVASSHALSLSSDLRDILDILDTLLIPSKLYHVLDGPANTPRVVRFESSDGLFPVVLARIGILTEF
jgi:hypothetical protein